MSDVETFTYTLGQHCLATGKNCHSPEEVGAIVRQLNKAEAERDELLAARSEAEDTHPVTGTLNTNLTTLVKEFIEKSTSKEFYDTYGWHGVSDAEFTELGEAVVELVGYYKGEK